MVFVKLLSHKSTVNPPSRISFRSQQMQHSLSTHIRSNSSWMACMCVRVYVCMERNRPIAKLRHETQSSLNNSPLTKYTVTICETWVICIPALFSQPLSSYVHRHSHLLHGVKVR